MFMRRYVYQVIRARFIVRVIVRVKVRVSAT